MELAEKRPELEKQLTAKTLNLSDLNLSSARRLIAPPTPAQPSEPKRKPEKPKTERYKSIENDLIACLKDLREKAESYAAGTIEALKETVEDQKSPDRAGTGEADAVGESGDAEKVWMEPTLQCDWCRTEFAPKKWWARFCSLKCRNGFHSHERKARRAFLNAASTKEIAGLRKRVDGNAIVSALIGRAYAVAEQLQLPEINGNGHADFVEENAVAPAVAPDGWRRRAL
jgi:hypothetical protein